MTKRDVRRAGAQHPRSQALLELVEKIAGECLEHPDLDLPGNDRHGLQQPSI